MKRYSTLFDGVSAVVVGALVTVGGKSVSHVGCMIAILRKRGCSLAALVSQTVNPPCFTLKPIISQHFTVCQ